MKKNYFSLRRKAYSLMSLAAGVLLFASCAQDGFDEENFDSGVYNTQLESPSIEDISITASADGSQTIIKWPVIYGAGGYYCTVYDVSIPDEPVAVDGIENKLIDGCSLVVTRTEDTNFKFIIRTAGNDRQNNKEAKTSTEVTFTSFLEAYASIPSGTDLYEYFQNNPLPDTSEELAIDLIEGGQYTVSNILDFGANKIQIRCTNKINKATITYGQNGTIRTSAPLTLKNLNFYCSASSSEAIGLSQKPDESIIGATGQGDYYNITGALYITNCNFDGVNAQFINDNNVKYCLETCIIDNSVVKLTSTSESGVNSNAIIYFKSGFINTLTVRNSTFWQASTTADSKYFIQYNNSGRSTRAGYAMNYINFTNSTFYNIAGDGQWGNYSGFAGQKTSTFVMTNCIFVDCAKEIARRFIGGNFSASPQYTFLNNTYLQDASTGTYDNEENYDKSGTAIKSDPQFSNPANGDFTVNGSEQLSKRTGDPRWLPETE
ncbi:DUF4992 family lipoprotein [uncultured Prevotella sp.]|uniref:DUF4992 family lipoprotein n=1 Tax=uncultured Prevotella sp. TaxID=159272 RepID=UPI002638D576|nr:DUF4992 family lipoprotein [uncultured Prevotella sp.]